MARYNSLSIYNDYPKCFEEREALSIDMSGAVRDCIENSFGTFEDMKYAARIHTPPLTFERCRIPLRKLLLGAYQPWGIETRIEAGRIMLQMIATSQEHPEYKLYSSP